MCLIMNYFIKKNTGNLDTFELLTLIEDRFELLLEELKFKKITQR